MTILLGVSSAGAPRYHSTNRSNAGNPMIGHSEGVWRGVTRRAVCSPHPDLRESQGVIPGTTRPEFPDPEFPEFPRVPADPEFPRVPASRGWLA